MFPRIRASRQDAQAAKSRRRFRVEHPTQPQTPPRQAAYGPFVSLARDVVRLLRRAIAAVAAARDTTTAIQNQADEIIAEIRTATDGSTAERPAEAIVRLEQAKVKLDEAKIELQAGTAAAEEYIEHLEGGGSGGSPDTTSRPSTPP